MYKFLCVFVMYVDMYVCMYVHFCMYVLLRKAP